VGQRHSFHLDAPSHSRGGFRPSFASSPHPLEPRGRREDRVPAGTRGPPCAKAVDNCTAAYRWSRKRPAFPAQWFYGLCPALPGDEFLLVTVALRIRDASNTGWVDAPPQGLTVATTVRTTRFCRTRSSRDRHRVFRRCTPDRKNVGETNHQRRSSARRKGSRGSAQSSARPARTISCPTLPRPPQPRPRSVTTYDRPSWWAGMANTYGNSELR
jgi:hypothetical protein